MPKSDKYLETVENDYRVPDGTWQGSWFKHDILLYAQGKTYNIRVKAHQSTPDVPVTLIVERGLIDIYLGH